MNMPTKQEIDDWHEECAVDARGPESSIGFWPFEVGGDDLAEIVVATLSRWGSLATSPAPELGEVARFAAWLQEHAGQCAELGRPDWAHMAARAATLLEQQQHLLGLAGKELDAFIEQQAAPPAVVPVAERLPEPGVKVLAHYFNVLGNGRTICAIWVPAKSHSDDIDNDDDFLEYDEEKDAFYWPEGWYEQIENWESYGWIKVNEGEVVCWQPLPEWPAHAIPLPQAGEVK
jgi:hypothetical protein